MQSWPALIKTKLIKVTLGRKDLPFPECIDKSEVNLRLEKSV